MRGLTRAAHPMQQRSDGTKRSKTRVASSQRRMGAQPRPVGSSVRALQKRMVDQRDPHVRVSTRRTKDNFTAALVPSAEAWAVTVSVGTENTPVVLEALPASTSACAGERQANAQRQVSAWLTLSQATKVPTSTSVSPASLVLLGGEAGAITSRAQETSRKPGQRRMRNVRKTHC